MGEGTPIDSLQVEIEASSSKAVDEVNKLSNSLKSLKNNLKLNFGDNVSKIKKFGDEADVTSTKVSRLTKEINNLASALANLNKFSGINLKSIIPDDDKSFKNIKENIKRGRKSKGQTQNVTSLANLDKSARSMSEFEKVISDVPFEVLDEFGNVVSSFDSYGNRLAKELNTIKDEVGSINSIKIDGPKISTDTIDDIKETVNAAKDFKDVIYEAEESFKKSDIGGNIVDEKGKNDIKDSINYIEKLEETTEKLKGEKITPEIDTKKIINVKDLLDGIDSKSIKIDLKGEDVNQLSDIKKQIEDLGYTIDKVNTSTKDGAISGVSILAKNISGDANNAKSALESIGNATKGTKKNTDDVKQSVLSLADVFKALKLLVPSVFGSMDGPIKNIQNKLEGLKILAPNIFGPIQRSLNKIITGKEQKIPLKIEPPKDDATRVVNNRLETLRTTAENVGNTVLDGPTIPDSVSDKVDELTYSFENLGDIIDKVNIKGSGAFNDIGEELIDPSSVDSLMGAINESNSFNDIGERLLNPEQVDDMMIALKGVQAATSGTASGLEGVASAAGEIGATTGGIEGATAALGGMEGAATGAAGAAGGLSGALGPIGIAIAAIAAVVAVVVPIIIDGMKQIGSITGVVVNKLKEMAPAAKEAIKSLAVGTIKKFGEGLKSIGTSLKDKFIGPFENAIKSVKKWKDAIGRVAFYRAVREAIKVVTDGFKEGIENLYYYSQLVGTEFAPAMDSLATSALYLRNSLGAMAAPLIQALAPAIDFIIDKFVALLNVIGKVFAALTGKSTYTQAVKTTKKWGDALDSAAGSAKEFQRYLMGIDELNIMQEPSGGGAGAGLDTDYGSMFEEVEVPTEISDWANEVRLAIEAGDWRSVGELIAQKLNEIIDAWDSYAWGVKLGNLINNGLNIAYGFLTTFDFEKFGAKIADFFNGMFDTIDWDLLGRTIAAGWNGLFNFVYGFATTLRWKDIGLDIATAINGFLDEINLVRAAEAISAFVVGVLNLFNTAISETNWNVLGTKLGEFLNNIDWYGIVFGVLSLIANALTALKEAIDSFLATWDWKKQADDIARAINDAFASVDWRGLGESLGNAFITAFNFLRETISKIDWRQIGVDIANFILGINWVELFGGLSGLLATAINAAVSLVSGLLDTLGPNLQSIAEGIAQKINEFVQTVNWEKLGQTIHDGIKMALEFLITVMDNLDWEAIGNAIGDFLEALDWGDILSTWGEVLGTAIGGVLETIDVGELLDVGMNIAGGLFEGMLKKFDEEGGIGGWIEKNFVSLLISVLKALLGIHSPSEVMKSEIGVNISAGILDGIKEGWEGITSFLSGAVEGLASFILDPWGTIQEGLGQIWGAITGDAQTKFGQTRQEIANSVDGTNTDVNTKWDKIRSDLGGKWDSIGTDAGTKFEVTRGNIGKAWDNANNDAESKWGTIGQNLDSKWDAIGVSANNKFDGSDGVRGKIRTAWDNTHSDTDSKWTEINNTLDSKYSEMNSNTESKFSELASTVSEKMGGLAKEAVNWGSDIVSGIASGIEKAKSAVTTAVSNVASNIKSLIHFSEPDIGPLSDFHTYMPDMMQLMAKGINDNSHLAVNAVSDVASEMSNAFQSVSAEDMEFPIHEEMYSHITADVANANAQTANGGDAFGENMRVANGDVVSAIMAAAAQIVAAVNENGDRPINLDMGKVSSAVTTTQNRQNKMYGKTLQNG